LLAFENGGAQNQNQTHLKVKNFFGDTKSYRKLGLKADAFVDLEFRLNWATLLESDLYELLIDLIAKIIQHYQALPSFNQNDLDNPLTIISKIVDYVNPFSSSKVKKSTNEFFEELARVGFIENVTFHTETGVGIAAGVALSNIEISGHILALGVYHMELYREANWQLLESEQSAFNSFIDDPLVKQVLLFFLL
jgi:hypothetical protein